MPHVNVVPSNGRLLNDGVAVGMRIFMGVDSPIVEPVGDGTAKGIDEARFCIYLVEPGADGFDVAPAEFQSGCMSTKYHMGRGLFFSTQAAGVMSLLFPSV